MGGYPYRYTTFQYGNGISLRHRKYKPEVPNKRFKVLNRNTPPNLPAGGQKAVSHNLLG
jgi:hypothetical protein